MKIIYDRRLALLFTLLCTGTYLLNFFNKIVDCSLVFIGLAFTSNIIAALYGKRNATISLLLSVIISFGLLRNVEYYIHGQAIPGVIVASLISVLFSVYLSTRLFLRLQSTYSLNESNAISLMLSAILDGIVMSVFFIRQFSLEQTRSIFAKEVLFKCLYSLVIYAVMHYTLPFIKKIQLKNKTS